MKFFATSCAFEQLFAQMHIAFFIFFYHVCNRDPAWFTLQGLLVCQGSHRHSSVCTPPATQGTVPNDCWNSDSRRSWCRHMLKSFKIDESCPILPMFKSCLVSAARHAAWYQFAHNLHIVCLLVGFPWRMTLWFAVRYLRSICFNLPGWVCRMFASQKFSFWYLIHPTTSVNFWNRKRQFHPLWSYQLIQL